MNKPESMTSKMKKASTSRGSSVGSEETPASRGVAAGGGKSTPDEVDYGGLALDKYLLKMANMKAGDGEIPQSVSGDAVQQEYARVSGELETQMASTSLITESQKEKARSNLRNVADVTLRDAALGYIDDAQYNYRMMDGYMWDVASERMKVE